MHPVYFMVFVAMVTSSTVARRCVDCHRLCCGKFCGQVFMLMLFLTVCSASNNNKYKKQIDRKTCSRGAITPRDPYFFEGEDIVLNCSRQKGGWKGLTFLQGPGSEEVPEKYITQLNRSAIQLRIPNISREDVDRTKVSTFYRCVNKKNKAKCYDNVYVSLEYYVRTPVNLTCRDYNFDRMTCSWSLGVEEYHQQNAVNVSCSFRNGTEDVTSLEYTVYPGWSIQNITREGPWESCPHLNNTACTWGPEPYPAPAPDFVVRVKVHNTRRNSSKLITKTFSKYDIVEPALVSKLSHRASSRCLELKWKSPKKDISFLYDITYKSACSSEKSVRTFSTDAEICDLVPHTKYNINVKARVTMQGVEKGHWSSPKDYDAMTHADVLDVNQKTLPGLYDISPSEDGHSSVTVYWTPLPSCDLHDTPDSMTYKVTAHNVTLSVKHPEFSAEITVPEQKIINVTLQASNSVGHPESNRVVTVFPRTDGPHPSELIIQYNRTNEDCVTTAEVVVRENSSRFFNITHTIVWCKGKHHICKEPLEWKELEENVTSFMLPGNKCDAYYSYGLVTNGHIRGQDQIVTTGIQWEECIYKLGEVPSTPLEIDDKRAVNHGFFVKWSHYDCNVVKAYITHYQVTYCTGAAKNEEECECTGEKRHNKSRLNDTFKADGFSAGDKVCVWIQGISKAGPGPEKLVHIEIADQTNMSHLIVAVFCAIIVAVAILAIFVFLCCYNKCKSYREKNEIRIPEYAEDIRDNLTGYEDPLDSCTRLINSRTSGTGTGSGNEHIVYQETETTGVQGSSNELSFLNHGQNKERNLDLEFKGYKNPESLQFDDDESDVHNDSVDEGESDVYNDLDKEESIIGNKQPEANHNKNGISFAHFEQNGREKNTHLKKNACSLLGERHLSTTQCTASNIKIEEIVKNSKSSNNFKEEIELHSVGFNNQPSESEADEEEISFENLTSDFNEIPDGYKGVLYSGSTYIDSDNERPEVNTSVVDQNEKQDENEPAHVGPDFLTSNAIESSCKSTSEPVYLSDAAESESDIDSTSDIKSSSDDFISGYKQSKDICSISGSIGSLDSVSHMSTDKEREKDFIENSSGGDNMINKESSSNESNHGNSGTSSNVPSYIIKTDQITFEESQSKANNTDENGKRRNGFVIQQ